MTQCGQDPTFTDGVHEPPKNMSYTSLHWSIFNILARLFGLMAALVSLAFGLTALLQLRGSSLSTPGVSALGNLVVALFCLAMALGFLFVRPYRPDVKRKSLEEPPPKLGWWTGAPRP